MAAIATKSLGKSGFVKEYLNDNPRSNPITVNDAWKAAGMEGIISPSLVNKIRGELGLSGNLRSGAGRKKTTRVVTKRRGRVRSTVVASKVMEQVVVAKAAKSNGRHISDIEADLDRILFKVMNLGNLTHLEENLRKTRRSLYVGH